MQPGVFRWKISASLRGQEALLRSLLERADEESRRAALEKISHLIELEAERLVPRESGELEGEVVVFREGDMPSGVGVPASSPAIHKARATEYGTWNYDVGEPGAPKTEWAAKSKPTAAMPWLRTAVLVAKPRALRYLRRFFITSKKKRSQNDHP